MVLFNSEGRITKYETVEDILQEYCGIRLELYEKRKQNIMSDLKQKYSLLSNKYKFIKAVLQGDINWGDTESVLDTYLVKNSFTKKDGSYDYLWSIPIRSLTQSRMTSLKETMKRMKTELSRVKSLTPTDMWKEDLDKLTLRTEELPS